MSPSVSHDKPLDRAVLFHASNPSVEGQTIDERRRAVVVLQQVLRVHHANQVIVRNACLTLRRFHTFTELAPYASTLCQLLLDSCLIHDDLVVRWAATTLCSQDLAALQPATKRRCVKHGAVARMIRLIDVLPRPETHDGQDGVDTQRRAAFAACWTFLWNITDESAENCREVIQQQALPRISATLEVRKRQEAKAVRRA